MEPFYPNFVAGVYQPVDHHDSDMDTNDGAPISRDSALSDRSPTPPSFSPILSLQSREACNGDSISTVPWSPDASIAVSVEPPAAFEIIPHRGTSEEPDLQLFLSGEEEEEVLQALRECPDAGQVMEEAQWTVAPVGWRVDTHQRRLP